MTAKLVACITVQAGNQHNRNPIQRKLTAFIPFLVGFLSPSKKETSMSCRDIAEGIENGNLYFALKYS